jgi:membrane protein DedA with SNARE-associated domain
MLLESVKFILMGPIVTISVTFIALPIGMTKMKAIRFCILLACCSIISKRG